MPARSPRRPTAISMTSPKGDVGSRVGPRAPSDPLRPGSGARGPGPGVPVLVSSMRSRISSARKIDVAPSKLVPLAMRTTPSSRSGEQRHERADALAWPTVVPRQQLRSPEPRAAFQPSPIGWGVPRARDAILEHSLEGLRGDELLPAGLPAGGTRTRRSAPCLRSSSRGSRRGGWGCRPAGRGRALPGSARSPSPAPAAPGRPQTRRRCSSSRWGSAAVPACGARRSRPEAPGRRSRADPGRCSSTL